MMSGGHPRDQWVEITEFGRGEPRYLLARDGREVVISEAKELYVHERISIDEFERTVEEALTA